MLILLVSFALRFCLERCMVVECRGRQGRFIQNLKQNTQGREVFPKLKANPTDLTKI